MTQPRRVLPGMTVMVTRRTLRRTHLLRPDPKLNALFTYCLAVMAERHGILVHAAVLMSTHEHLIVTDTRGRLPRFLQDLHRMIAFGVKVLRKWEGAVWDHEKTSVVELRTAQAVLEKLAYVMANPVAAGLVHRAAQWPGITLQPDQLGRVCWNAARPDLYFDQDNAAWPRTASVQLTMPPGLDMSDSAVRTVVAAELARLERAASAHVRANGWRVVGRERLSDLSPYQRAKSWEPLRGRNPTFAVGRGQREAFSQAVAALRAFRRAYRHALDSWTAGLRTAVFPLETWLMRWVHGVVVAPT